MLDFKCSIIFSKCVHTEEICMSQHDCIYCLAFWYISFYNFSRYFLHQHFKSKALKNAGSLQNLLHFFFYFLTLLLNWILCGMAPYLCRMCFVYFYECFWMFLGMIYACLYCKLPLIYVQRVFLSNAWKMPNFDQNFTVFKFWLQILKKQQMSVTWLFFWTTSMHDLAQKNFGGHCLS